MPEALTDEQILGIDDSPSPDVSSESPETAETPSSVETQPEETAEQTQLGQEQAKPETLAQSKPQDKTQQPTKQPTDKPATTPEAQETIAAKAAELDRSDQAFLTDDAEGKYQTFQSLFGDNPAALEGAMWSARQFAQVTAPETLAQHDRMVGHELHTNLKTWDAFQTIYDSALQAGDKRTAALVDRLAARFQQSFGIGPKTPEVQAGEWQEYTGYLDRRMDQDIAAQAIRVFGPQFSKATPANRAELIKAARLEVQDRLRGNRKLAAALPKLYQAYSVKDGTKAYEDVIAPAWRALVPLVVSRLAKEYGDLFKSDKVETAPQPKPLPAKPIPAAPKNMAEARSRGMSMSDVLKATLGETEHGSFLPQEEADQMTPEDILNSSRVPLPRKPWRPENVFDEAGR